MQVCIRFSYPDSPYLSKFPFGLHRSVTVGPGVGPDTTTVPGAESLHSSGASPSLPSGASNPPAGADVPSSAAVPEPVGPQPEGTSVGVGMFRTCL